jgi:hypothetical protein
MLVVIVAVSGPVPASPFVASARVNLPPSGSSPPCWTTAPVAEVAGAGLDAAVALDALVVVVVLAAAAALVALDVAFGEAAAAGLGVISSGLLAHAARTTNEAIEANETAIRFMGSGVSFE